MAARHATRAMSFSMLAGALILAALTCGPSLAQAPQADPGVAAAQIDLIRLQAETEKARQEYYRKQSEASLAQAKEDPDLPMTAKFLKDPADAVAAFGAVVGMFIAFFVLMGNRSAARRDRRDERFYEALRGFGAGLTPAGRVASAGLLAQMGRVREGRSYPYLDTAADQLIAGYRLEESEAARDAIVGALRQLIEAEPLRVRKRLSAAGIKLTDE